MNEPRLSRSASREEAQLFIHLVRKVHADGPGAGAAVVNPCSSDSSFGPLHGTVRCTSPASPASPESVNSAESPTLASPLDDAEHRPEEVTPVDTATRKRMEKRRGNRLAAKRCRERKKEYIAFLEGRVETLEASIATLQSTLQEISRPSSGSDD